MTRKSDEHLRMTYGNSFFDLISSHQQYIPWSQPLEIEPATTDCRVETLQLSQQFISFTSDTKLIIMAIARTINLNVSCKLHPYSLQRTRSHPGPRLPMRIRNTHCELNYNDRKIQRTPTHNIRKHWTAVSTLLGLIKSAYNSQYIWFVDSFLNEPDLIFFGTQ